MVFTSVRRVGLLVTCVAAGCADSPPPDEAPDPRAEDVATVRRYIGRDLWEPPLDLEPLEQALSRLDPACSDDSPFRTKLPRYVWPFGREGQPGGLLVLFAETRRERPGSTGLRLTAFDADGGVRARSEFTTGHRRYFKGARLEPFVDGAEPAVVMDCVENLGPFVGTDYYALVGDRFDLVRVQDSFGPGARNDYHFRHFTRGPAPLAQGAGDWEADLCSVDRARVLRALVWLGGRHGPIRQGQEATAQDESAADIELVRAVRARLGVVAQLRTLTESDDEWVREAARLAVQPDDPKR